MPRLIVVLFALIYALPICGQNYIGLHKDKIRKLVSVELEGFTFENEVSNKNRSFIKFVHPDEEQTLLFMLDKDGVCTSVSRMYNTWMYERVKKDLKKRCTSNGADTWTEFKNGEAYEIVIKQGQWFLTVITRKKR